MKTINEIPCGISCPLYDDYLIDETALQEAEELSHQNWLEINRLYNRIRQLEGILSRNGIDIPADTLQKAEESEAE
jgi:hypothetical protein